MQMRKLGWLGASVLTYALVACGADSLGSNDISYGYTTSSSTSTSGTTTSSSSSTGEPPPPPPEKELESSFRAPVATGKYVWIANPDSGRIAYIDAETLQIQIVDAGHRPTYLAAVPDATDDVAIVLNTASSDATVLRAAKGKLTSFSLPVHATANRWSVSPDGRWATAWTDATEIKGSGLSKATILMIGKPNGRLGGLRTEGSLLQDPALTK